MPIRQYQRRSTKVVQTSTTVMSREDGWVALAEPGEKVIALETDSHMQEGKVYTVKARKFVNGLALYDFGIWNRYAYRFKLYDETPAEVSCL